MADPISPYLSLIQFIVERFEAYRNRAQLEREKEASRILQSANILAVSLQELDNAFKLHTLRLRTFRATFTEKDREEIEYEVRKFAEQRIILPHIRDATTDLMTFASRSNEEYASLVKQLADYGKEVADSAVKDSEFTTLFGEARLDIILREMWSVKDDDAAERVRDKTREMLNVYDRGAIDAAGIRFRELKDMILRKYPNIPQPL